MKKHFFLFLGMLATLAGTAQKTINDPNAELRKTGSFHEISVSGGIDLYISSGDEAVAISAKDAESRARIRTEVKDGVLKIWYEWKEGLHISIGGNKALKAYVSYKTLNKLSASGGCDVFVEGTINAPDLSVAISGGSDFKGRITGSKLTIVQSGGSDMHLSGAVESLTLTASGGSDFNGYDFATDFCSATATGGSDIHITVNKEISAAATGASDIHWKGSARAKAISASGAGSVSHRS